MAQDFEVGGDGKSPLDHVEKARSRGDMLDGRTELNFFRLFEWRLEWGKRQEAVVAGLIVAAVVTAIISRMP